MRQTLRISSILGGWSPSAYFSREGDYLASIAIDPDIPISTSDTRTSGAIVPTRYEDFTGANINDEIVGIVNNPKDTKTYVAIGS